MIKKYLKYIEIFNIPSKEVRFWITHNLKNYLEKNKENQGEIEHILDYLVNKNPRRLKKMSYVQALSNTNKWMEALVKKGKDIEEVEGDDFDVFLDFKDGFKIIKLKSKKSYERESKLMSHCVSIYFNKSDKIYSLRDKKNMPHCTLSRSSQQIKGKGNGKIHPRYINYVIKFLEFSNIKVRDSEMENLGYINMFKLKDKIENKLYRDKYLFEEETIFFKGKYRGYKAFKGDVHSLKEYKKLPKKTFIIGEMSVYNVKKPIKFKQKYPISGGIFFCGCRVREFIQSDFIGGGVCLVDDEVAKFEQTDIIGGDINLRGTKIKEFVQTNEIGGNLNLSNTKIKEFIQTARIGGSLDLRRTKITEFIQNYIIGGSLYIRGSFCPKDETNIRKFEQNASIGGSLDLQGAEIKEFEQNHPIGGELDFRFSKIEKFEQNAFIGGNLNLRQTKIKEFKQKAPISGGLLLSDTNITEFIQTKCIGSSIDLSNTKIKEFIQTYPIDGSLDLSNTKITKFVQKYRIESYLYLNDTKIKKFELNYPIKCLEIIHSEIEKFKQNAPIEFELKLIDTNIKKFKQKYSIGKIYFDGKIIKK